MDASMITRLWETYEVWRGFARRNLGREGEIVADFTGWRMAKGFCQCDVGLQLLVCYIPKVETPSNHQQNYHESEGNSRAYNREPLGCRPTHDEV